MELVTISRLCDEVKELVPSSEFIAMYNALDENLKASLKQYSKRDFIYILTFKWEDDSEAVIYVGKSFDQYNRMLMHDKKYDYDKIYLFAIPKAEQMQAEKTVIENLEPLYNRSCNESGKIVAREIGLNYEEDKTKNQIVYNIRMLLNNRLTGCYTYHIHRKYTKAIQMAAGDAEVSENEYLEGLLEQHLPKDIVVSALKTCDEYDMEHQELVSVKEYARIHGRSVEQIKVLCREQRIPGAQKFGRDWMIPRLAEYPKDRRFK